MSAHVAVKNTLKIAAFVAICGFVDDSRDRGVQSPDSSGSGGGLGVSPGNFRGWAGGKEPSDIDMSTKPPSVTDTYQLGRARYGRI